jgi:hypothetical protein
MLIRRGAGDSQAPLWGANSISGEKLFLPTKFSPFDQERPQMGRSNLALRLSWQGRMMAKMNVLSANLERSVKSRSNAIVGVAIAIGVFAGWGCERKEEYRQLTDTSCNYGVGDLGGEVRVPRREHWREMKWNDPPPKPLRIRKADLRRYPRPDFSLLLEDFHGNRVDTRNGTATIDMIADPDTTIALRFTATELDTIYHAAIAMRIFDYLEPHPVLETAGGGMCPDNVYHLRVDAGGQVRELRWSTHYNPGGKTLDEWRRLYDLVCLVNRIVTARPECQALPNPRGAYM